MDEREGVWRLTPCNKSERKAEVARMKKSIHSLKGPGFHLIDSGLEPDLQIPYLLWRHLPCLWTRGCTISVVCGKAPRVKWKHVSVDKRCRLVMLQFNWIPPKYGPTPSLFWIVKLIVIKGLLEGACNIQSQIICKKLTSKAFMILGGSSFLKKKSTKQVNVRLQILSF